MALRDKPEPVTVGMVNYNGMNMLAETIRSIQSLRYPVREILLADDGSTDGSVGFVRKHFPEITVIAMPENTKMANRLRSILLERSQTRLVYLTDNDLIFDPDCLSELVSAMRQLPNAAMCTARVLEKENPSIIYSDGNALNYVCNSISENRGEPLAGKSLQPKISIGCIGNQLVDREKAARIGFLDGDLSVGWGDDGEFHHRLRMAGYHTYLVPKAIAYHPRKTKGFRTVAQVKNRAFFLIKNYSFKTLCFIFPALVVYEICIILFLIMKKDMRSYWISQKEIVRHLPALFIKRSYIQRIREVPDRELMTAGPLFMFSHLLDNKWLIKGLTFLNAVFIGYWKLVKKII